MALALIPGDDAAPSPAPNVATGLNEEQMAAVRRPAFQRPEDEGAWDHSEYTNTKRGDMTGRSSASMSSLTSNFTVSSAKDARKKRGKKKPMKFRIYVKDSTRWFEMWCYDPPATTIEDVKFKIFLSTGIRPHCELFCLPALCRNCAHFSVSHTGLTQSFWLRRPAVELQEGVPSQHIRRG